MTADRTLPILLSMSALALALGGAGVVVEARPFLAERGDLSAVAEAIVEAPSVSPLASVFALDRFAGNCDRVISAAPGVDLNRALAAAAAEACEQRLTGAIRWVSGWSYGWLVLAKIAERRGETVAIAEFLERSHETAPAQYWLAANRFIVAMRHERDLPADYGRTLDADIGVLAGTDAGAALLARSYVAMPGFRERLVGLVTAEGTAAERRFLYHVRAALDPDPQP